MFDSLKKMVGPLPVPPVPEPLWKRVRPTPAALSDEVHLVQTAEHVDRMVAEVSRMPVAYVGLDFEFKFPVADEQDIQESGWQDVSTLTPVAAGLAVVVRDAPGRLVAVRYALDVRRREVRDGLGKILSMPLTFVAHFFKSEYLAVRALGLSWPRAFFCTWLAAQLESLGRFHARYEDSEPVDESAEMAAEETAKERRRGNASLLSLARRHAVVWPFHGDKTTMRRRFMTMPDDQPLTAEDAAYVTADAYTAAGLYLPLRVALVEKGIDHHYDHVELPDALALAEIERRGMRVDRDRIALARQASVKAVADYERRLAEEYGFSTRPSRPDEIVGGMPVARTLATSHHERSRAVGSLGRLHLFRSPKTAAGYSFRKELLKQHRGAHALIDLLYRHGKYSRLVGDKLLDGQFIGTDDRVHAWIHPLGADSGRPSFKWPNVVGIGKVLRPIVVPDGPDYGLVELDYSAQEVFIAAAVFGDEQLLADCNDGDPYMAMVRRLCISELRPGEADLDDKALAEARPDLRGRMKILMLATMYGMGIESIAAQAKTTVDGARRLREEFFARYPQLATGIELAQQRLRERGYVETVTGMKRFRGATGDLNGWERRWAVNSVIQGGGACILKLLLPRLEAHLAEHDGRVVLPIFDAVLVQAPMAKLKTVAEGSKKIMIATMQELYPSTRPRVDVNLADPTCWNKAGRGDSIERFLENPDFKP